MATTRDPRQIGFAGLFDAPPEETEPPVAIVFRELVRPAALTVSVRGEAVGTISGGALTGEDRAVLAEAASIADGADSTKAAPQRGKRPASNRTAKPKKKAGKKRGPVATVPEVVIDNPLIPPIGAVAYIEGRWHAWTKDALGGHVQGWGVIRPDCHAAHAISAAPPRLDSRGRIAEPFPEPAEVEIDGIGPYRIEWSEYGFSLHEGARHIRHFSEVAGTADQAVAIIRTWIEKEDARADLSPAERVDEAEASEQPDAPEHAPAPTTADLDCLSRRHSEPCQRRGALQQVKDGEDGSSEPTDAAREWALREGYAVEERSKLILTGAGRDYLDELDAEHQAQLDEEQEIATTEAVAELVASGDLEPDETVAGVLDIGPHPNKHGVFSERGAEVLELANPRKNWRGLPLARIRLLDLGERGWIQADEMWLPEGGYGGPLSSHDPNYPTRAAALASGVADIRRRAEQEVERTVNKTHIRHAKAVLAWLDTLL